MNNVAVAINTIQTVVDTNTTVVTYTTSANTPVTTGAQGPQGIPGISASTTISELYDTDLINVKNGSILIYRAADNMWEATTELTNQALNCGQY